MRLSPPPAFPDHAADSRPAAPASDLDRDLAAVARIGAVPTILRVISEVTGLRLALVARVTPDEWRACAVLDRMEFGLAVGDRLEVATTLCSEVRDSRQPILIEHASAEPAYCAHPTPKLYGFQSYIAVPILRPDGSYFGNVCALDAEPARLREPRTLAMMELFAELIGLQLSAEEASVRDRAALSDERETAELREQFIAVLGHDLRTPLAATLAGSGVLLERGGLDPMARTMIERINGSGRRMARLIDDIMDFARGRLGGGMPLARDAVDVEELVGQVVAEVASAHPARTLRVAAAGAGTARLDAGRVAQMLSNLVSNAVEHGAPGEPVSVAAMRDGARLRLIVTSHGQPIPPEVAARLFQPYVRAQGARPRTGLGLGLYIAAEIARAHGGSIAVASDAAGATTFTVELPAAG